ncbi:hypothetical protein E8E11_001169 [Didymella keratinophila]|nr:hypothetical protein E8E11_001169 [Didymella keratinophila]
MGDLRYAVFLGNLSQHVSMLRSLTIQLEHRSNRSAGGKPLFLNNPQSSDVIRVTQLLRPLWKPEHHHLKITVENEDQQYIDNSDLVAFNENLEVFRQKEMVKYSPFVEEIEVAAGGSAGTICCGPPTAFGGHGIRLGRVNVIFYTTGPVQVVIKVNSKVSTSLGVEDEQPDQTHRINLQTLRTRAAAALTLITLCKSETAMPEMWINGLGKFVEIKVKSVLPSPNFVSKISDDGCDGDYRVDPLHLKGV